MGKLWTALASYIGSATFWLLDKIWGDALFTKIKPLIPNWVLAGYPLTEVFAFVFSYGPPTALFLLGSFLFWSSRRKSTKSVSGEIQKPADELLEHLPDVRIADSASALSLFHGRDGDKLIPLLEAEKLIAWARPLGPGDQPPIRVPGNVWRTNKLEFHARGDNPHMRNQTFIKTKGRNETTYFDVMLNSVQLRRVWPNFESISNAVPSTLSAPKSELDWNFDKFGPAIGMSAGPEQQIRIHNFQARGWNRTADPITEISGYVRSDRTNKKYPIKINDGHGKMIPTDRIELIPVGAWMDVAAQFAEKGDTITLKEFLSEIVPFTFFFEYDGKQTRRSFTLEQIEPRVRDYEQQIRKSLVASSRIKTKTAEHAPASIANNTIEEISGNQGIITQGQSGNNTIFNVNHRFKRSLSGDTKAAFLRDLPKDKPVNVLGLNGNSESMNYAKEIHSFLKENDYQMVTDEPTWHMFFDPPVSTVNVSPGNSGKEWWIVVGAAE